MTVADSHAALITKIFELTLARRLEWDVEPFSSEVACLFSKYKVALLTSEDAEGTPYVVARIYNNKDEMIDSFTDNDLNSLAPPKAIATSYWKLMTRLENMARRTAMGADEAVKSIMQELEDKDNPF